MTPIIFHADMDAFYASVEQLDRPELIGKAVIVGGLASERGVVAACSYEARKFGVHSAMSIAAAQRLCPHAVYLRLRMERYRELSTQTMALFNEFSPEVRAISVDEAFLDMSGTEGLFGTPEQAARTLKTTLLQRLGLTVSIGIASNRLIAKMASAASKPDGLLLVPAGTEALFIKQIGLERLWGVGQKTLQKLKNLGLGSVESLQALSPKAIERTLGQSLGNFLYNAVRGIDPGIFPEHTKSKSISAEKTFPKDILDTEILSAVLLDMSQELLFRLLEEGFECKTIGIKLRYGDFETRSARKTLSSYILCSDDIHCCAVSLLDQTWNHKDPLRLLGVSLLQLEKSGATKKQGELFQSGSERKSKLEHALLDLKRRKGTELTRARLLPSPPPKKKD